MTRNEFRDKIHTDIKNDILGLKLSVDEMYYMHFITDQERKSLITDIEELEGKLL